MTEPPPTELVTPAVERPPTRYGTDDASLRRYLLPVLRLLAEGRTTVDIGVDLGLSPHTVKCRLAALYRALDARDRAHAVTRGFQRGYLTVGPPPVRHTTGCAARVRHPCTCGASHRATTEEET